MCKQCRIAQAMLRCRHGRNLEGHDRLTPARQYSTAQLYFLHTIVEALTNIVNNRCQMVTLFSY